MSDKLSFSKRFVGHLKTVMRHRHYVRKACFHMGIIWRGIKHDNSKYSPTEFWLGVKYFDGKISPVTKEKALNNGVSFAWAHHKGRNDHHWEYWVENPEVGEVGFHPFGVKMPYNALIEMFCDFIGAGKAYNPKTWQPADEIKYFEHFKQYRIYNKETDAFFTSLLMMLAKLNDEKKFYAWYRVCRKTLRYDYEHGEYAEETK